MKILRMTAVFGKLDGDTLECRDGLNVFTLPNEAGKTTWSAFLLAMLYGVNTRERTKDGSLAVKEKYAPWNGKPMQGRIDLLWNGRAITIERTSTARVPFGIFRAYDTATGDEIAELTADNCGQVLLGVTRESYERSAFIGQNALAVTQEASLEQRLSSLASTGDESVSFSEVSATLRQWKNHIRSNAANGKLIEAEREQREVRAKLDEIAAVHRGDLALLNERQQLESERTELKKAQALLQLKEKAEAAAKAKAMRKALAEAQDAADEAAKRAEGLPDGQALEDLERRMDQLEANRDNFAKLAAPQMHLPDAPDAPQPLRGLSADEAQAKGRADAQILKKSAVCIPAVILAVFGAVALILKYFIVGGALLAAALVWQIVFAVLRGKEKKAVRDAYNAFDVETTANAYAQKLREYEAAAKAEQSRVDEETAARDAQQQALAQEQQDILLVARAFASSVYEMGDARKAVIDAKDALQKKNNAAINLEATKRMAAQMEGDFEDVVLPPEAEEETRTLSDVTRRLDAVSARLEDVGKTLAQHRGAVEGLGDSAALAAEEEHLQDRIDALNARFAALDLAMQTLGEANDELRARFSPQLNKEASAILAALTDSRYETLAVDRNLNLTATEHGAVVSHPLLWLSGGATDQAYLALRLAIAHLALPENAPLVLDDALVYFDDARLNTALCMLQSEAQSRQILLFTCQKREQNLMKG